MKNLKKKCGNGENIGRIGPKRNPDDSIIEVVSIFKVISTDFDYPSLEEEKKWGIKLCGELDVVDILAEINVSISVDVPNELKEEVGMLKLDYYKMKIKPINENCELWLLEKMSNDPISPGDIWEDTDISRDMEELIKKHEIDFKKLLDCLNEKGQDILTGAGAILGFDDLGYRLVQCYCGEVLGFPEHVYKKIIEYEGESNIKCKRCDPGFVRRIADYMNK